jgi:Prenyltransferase and squalene oxidase repeat
MKKWLFFFGFVMACAGFTTLTSAPSKNDPKEIRTAVSKSLDLLQRCSHTFLENAGACHSCHHNDLAAISFPLAKEKGFHISDTVAHETLDAIYNNNWNLSRAGLIENDDVVAVIMIGGYDMWALSANHYPPSKSLEMLVQNVLHRQTKNGNWVSPNPRPPLEYYAVTATALTVKGILAYSTPYMHDEVVQRVNRARAWLETVTPVTNEEKVYQLLGLMWSGGNPKIIEQQSKKLLTAQREDGGWSQLPSLESDAYATGESLYALNQTGQLKTDDPAYQKGISYLLTTQLEDGSWKVQTRSFPVIPYVETGFPHGKSQFISAAGTTWATMALLLSFHH